MSEQEIIARINESLAEEFELDLDSMRPETTLYDELGLDSLDAVDMVIVLEGAFNFKIREEGAVRKIRTIGDIHDFVLAKLQELEKAS